MVSPEFSPWTIAQSDQPKWRPGEELAASAFLGMVFLYFFDINVSIIRVFKRRKGLYFWSLILATWGCFINAIGLICKYLIPNSTYLYGFYTICMMGSWSVFAPMQLMVLYSRLHLVNDNRKVQRWVLIVILSTLLTVILPTWVVVWPAYYPDPKISSVWSPRDAIVERYTQIVLTLVECFVSGVYIWSLLGLMHYKSSLRQRRVMLDLIYVNLICVAFDFLNLLLIYLNQLGLSHPIQVFGYILKLKLEFVVLNQLMAVAARGIQKQTFEERRYYKPTLQDTFAAEAKPTNKRPSKSTTDSLLAETPPRTSADLTARDSSADNQISAPSPTYQTATDSTSRRPTITNKAGPDRLEKEVTNLDDLNLSSSDPNDFDLHDYVEKSHSSGEGENGAKPLPPPPPPDAGSTQSTIPRRRHDSDATNAIRTTFSGETLGAKGGSSSSGPGTHHPERRRGPIHPMKATLRKHKPYKKRRAGDGEDEKEEEEEEIGVHMWERKGGEVVLEVPWFQRAKGRGEA